MSAHKSRFSQFDEDAYRLPEGMRRIAYDAETQRYTFRDRSGQLYQGPPGEMYGALKPVAAPLSHRRNVTIAERYDPALRRWDARPAKNFNEIVPPEYIASAQVGAEWATLPSDAFFSSDLVQGVVEVVRRRTTLKRHKSKAREPLVSHQAESAPSIPSVRMGVDDKRKMLEEGWEVVREDEIREVPQRVKTSRRTKSEIWPPKFFRRK